MIPGGFRYLAAAMAVGSLASASAVDEYDYVIVGSGPGGGSLAANLAANGNSVFLIEAGGDNSTSVLESLPQLSGRAAETPGHSWQFFVEHYANETQARRDPKYTYIQNNGSYYVGLDPPEGARPVGLYYPRGATLGGSAQVNAMNFAWPPDAEWDYIAEITKDKSWRHQHMRRHFMALENCTYVPQGTPGHGFDGFVESSLGNATLGLVSPNVLSVVRSMLSLAEGIETEGIAETAEWLRRDFNGIERDRYEDGFVFTTPAAISPTTASRSGVAEYINEIVAAGHPLTVSYHSLATKVLFEKSRRGKKPRATGVEYMVGEALYSADGRYDASQTGETRSVRARKEVIVSGGTFNTPQLLQLSGIGPRKELERFDIPVIVDLPAVGSYMQDNYESPLQVRAEVPWIEAGASPCTATFDEEDPCFIEWRDNASGPYASRFGSYNAIFRTSQSWSRDSDLMFLSNAGYGGITGFYPGYSNYVPRPLEWTTAVVKMQTTNAAGTVRLNSTDPRIRPNINLNYFAIDAERDIAAITEGMELLLRGFDQAGVPYTRTYPDPDVDFAQGIKDLTFSHHATSSCRMGPKNNKKYCVDSKFRVQGVENLRVVDASVLPRAPGGMPNAATFTISRKAFEVIVKDSA